MMDCQQHVALLGADLEGDLDPREVEQMREHMAGCNNCQAYAGTYRATMKLAGELATTEVEEMSQPAWMSRIDGG